MSWEGRNQIMKCRVECQTKALTAYDELSQHGEESVRVRCHGKTTGYSGPPNSSRGLLMSIVLEARSHCANIDLADPLWMNI